MAQLNIKPAAGQKLKLQRHTGADALTVDTHGNVQVSGTITTGTMTSAVDVSAHEIIKKFHHFSINTRTAGNSNMGANFTWTDTFTPLDPKNNQFHIHAGVPADSAGNDASGFGLRFIMSSTTAIAQGYAAAEMHWDFMGKGVQYTDANTTNRAAIQQYNFVIGAGVLPPGTFAVKHFHEVGGSHMQHYFPNSTDDARIGSQSQGELMIIEYGNV